MLLELTCWLLLVITNYLCIYFWYLIDSGFLSKKSCFFRDQHSTFTCLWHVAGLRVALCELFWSEFLNSDLMLVRFLWMFQCHCFFRSGVLNVLWLSRPLTDYPQQLESNKKVKKFFILYYFNVPSPSMPEVPQILMPQWVLITPMGMNALLGMYPPSSIDARFGMDWTP